MCAAQLPVCHGVSYPEKAGTASAATADQMTGQTTFPRSWNLCISLSQQPCPWLRGFLWSKQKHPPPCGAAVTVFFQPWSTRAPTAPIVHVAMFPLSVETGGRRSMYCDEQADDRLPPHKLWRLSLPFNSNRLSPAAYCACDCV